MSIDDVVWDDVRRLWVDGELSVMQLSGQFGLSYQRVVARARKDGWPARAVTHTSKPSRTCTQTSARGSKRVSGPAHRVPRAKGMGEKHGGGSVDEDELLRRLFEAIERIVSAIEERMLEEQPETLADTERLVRTLNALIQSVGKFHDVDDQFKKRRKTAKHKAQAARDAERRREDLAQRVLEILDDGARKRRRGT